MKPRRTNRLLALGLCLCLLLGVLPLNGMVLAAEQGCGHQHDQACGYVEAVEGKPCTFKHDPHDGSCGGVEGEEASPCTVEANHTHDTAVCGYVEAVTGALCTHSCGLCASKDVGNGCEEDGLGHNGVTPCALMEDCTLSNGHEGDCRIPMTLGASPQRAAFVPVTGIAMTNNAMVAKDTDLSLGATVTPDNATNQTVVWRVKNQGTTGAQITNGTFRATTAGTATIEATIENGLTQDTPYQKEFTIVVTDPATTLVVEFNDNGTGGADIDDNEMKTAVEAALGSKDKTKITTIVLTGSAAEITGWNWKYLLDLYRNNSDWTALTTLDLWGMSGLTKVEIGASSSFGFITKLTAVRFPNSIQTIGKNAFKLCRGLTSVNLPESLTTIEESAFSGCIVLTSVSLPGELTTIGKSAFYGCTGLTSMSLPESLTTIGDGAFDICSGLTAFTVDPKNQKFASKDGVLYDKDMQTLLKYPLAKSGTSFTIPDTVQTIGNGAFSECRSLTSVDFPEKLTTIGKQAFYYCDSLESMTFQGETPPSLGVDVFEEVSTTGTLYHPANAADAYASGRFGSRALDGWARQSTTLAVTFNNNGTGGVSIDDNAMKTAVEDALTQRGVDKTKITTIALTGNAAEITGWNWKYLLDLYRGDSDWTALTTLDLWGMSGLTKVENGASNIFYRIAKLTAVRFPDSLETIGKSAFYSCHGLTSVSLPEKVTTIGDSAFDSCSGLTSVSLPEKLTTIENYAFFDCRGLTSVSLSEKVTTIGNWAFSRCRGLTAFTVDPKNQKFASKDGVLYDKDMQTLLQYPLAKSGNSFTIPDTVQTIGMGAFRSCSGLTSVNFPEKLATIEYGAFWSCKGLKSVTFPEKLTTIRGSAFIYCNSLKSMTFQGETPPSLGSDAFEGVSADGTLYHPANAADAYASGRFGSPDLNRWTRVPLYALTVQGGSDEKGESLHLEGAQVQISAGAAPTGKIFDRWTGGDDSIFASGSRTDASTTITMPAANVTVTATYKDIPEHGLISGPEDGKPLDLTRDAVFSFAGEYAHFSAIRLNGHRLTQTPTSGRQADLSGYPGYGPVLGNVQSGSVVVTLYKDFLQTLPDGRYTLEVEFLDGGVTSVGSTAFVIEREKPASSATPADVQRPGSSDNPSTDVQEPGLSDNPSTGDKSSRWAWALILLASGGGMAAAHRRRRQHE